MARRKNPLFVCLNTWSIIAFCRLTGILPLPVSRAIGRWIGRLGFYLVPRVRRVGLANQDLAYGDALSDKEKRRIVRRCAENVGIVAAEFSRTATFNKPGTRKLVTIQGLDNLDLTQGVILVGAHLGNWEWMAAALHTAFDKVAEVVQGVKDPRLDGYIDQIRSATGVRTVPKHGCGPELIRLVKEGWVVGILGDQSPRESAVPVDFFGQPCWATIGPAMLAARTKAPVHTVSMPRAENGHYTLCFSPALDLVRTGNLLSDLHENTRRCQDAIEAHIRQYPDQWLWLHRRWKKRPRLEREWQQRQKRKERQTAE